ncbi:MAG: monovalent cation:proton antiporter-2 (CPA2) family protein [Xanthomonadales bacterium]|nr:monovalent cation:proton antiporter-2 (CPA2) family protein [Xanthomonadales bacterium]
MELEYLTDILILLAAAVIAVPLARMSGLGTVPGFLLAGVIIGPSVLGLIEHSSDIAHVAELGVVFLLFVIGIELKPSRLWAMRRMVFGMGALQVVITGAAITGLAYYVFGVDIRAAILIGPAMALSSTAFVLQLLQEQKMFGSRYGSSSVAILLFQDLAVVPLLALVTLLSATGMSEEKNLGVALLEALAILALIIVGGRYLLQPILQRVARYGSAEVFTASAMLLVLGVAALMATIGLSMAMGAFVAGLLVADSEFRHQIMAEIQPFRGLLLGLFFMSMGMALELSTLWEHPLLSVSLVLGLLLLKTALLWPLTLLFGHRGGVAKGISLLLAQSGEFALVLFAVAFQSELIGQDLFQQLLVIVILSMLATPPIAALAYRLANAPILPDEDEDEASGHPLIQDATVVILGFGRVGRRVGALLECRGIEYVAVDSDTNILKQARAAGRSVFYGDASQLDVLVSLGVGDAGLVIVTVDDFDATEHIITSLHRRFPQLDILARGHNLEHCKQLKRDGAWLVVSENLEASLALAGAALNRLLPDDIENEAAIERFRDTYYAEIKAESRSFPE